MSTNSRMTDRKKGAIEEFSFILKEYIYPLLEIDGDPILKQEFTVSHNLKTHIKCYKKGASYFLYFFPALSTPQFHFRVKTNNGTQDLSAAEEILREILRSSKYDYRSSLFPSRLFYDKGNLYRNAVFDVAFEIGLCNWLGSECIYELISRLREWSQKTYEGNHMSFGFIIDAKKKTTGTIDYLSFLKSNHSAVFTDGMSSGIKLDNSGRIVKYFSAVHERTAYTHKHTPWAPYEFMDFTNMCCSDGDSEWIGVIMQSNGDMLIFKSRQLVFVKRNGKWMYLNSHTIHTMIMEQYTKNQEMEDPVSAKEFADEVYLSVLDNSFSHTGGCIAIIDNEFIETVQGNCFPKDSLDNELNSTEKKTIIKRLIAAGSTNSEKHYFQYLDRKLRLELLSLDGATVLDSSGRILCVGAIVKIDGGSDGGGRTAAAKELAKYGLSMKISMDGSIQFFASHSQEEPQEIFRTL